MITIVCPHEGTAGHHTCARCGLCIVVGMSFLWARGKAYHHECVKEGDDILEENR
jgi:hypothetical protein